MKTMSRLLLPLLLAGLLATGCAGVKTEITKNPLAKPGEVALKHMQLGMSEHLAGRWKESNGNLEAALGILEARPEIRLGQEMGSMILDEHLRDYDGDPSELLFIHTLGMLNFAVLGDVDEGLVEARRSDHLQNWLKSEGIQAQDDPLARCVSAVLYESKGAWGDAYIDIKKAKQAFGNLEKKGVCREPSFIGTELLYLADMAGDAEGLMKWRQAYPQMPAGLKGKEGGVLVLAYSGSVSRLLPGIAHDSQTRMRDGCAGVPGKEMQALEKVYDFKAMIQQDQERKKTGAVIRDVSRVAVRTAIMVGILALCAWGGVNPTGMDEVATRFITSGAQVDTRGWDNLPAEFHMAKLVLPEGRHTLRVEGQFGWGSQAIGQPHYKCPALEMAKALGEKDLGKFDIRNILH
jgi:hypothetical protein